MNILFIAPVPPPITGQSLAVQVFKDALASEHEIVMVNLSKNSFDAGINSLRRVLSIFKIWVDVWKKVKRADVIYFTISESVFGNLKDLVIYLISFRKLDRMFVHLHGGEGMKEILAPGNLLSKLNGFFLKRLKGVIVLGRTQEAIFTPFVSANCLYTVPNFAQDEFFIPLYGIKAKFENATQLRVLYLSNLVPGKGFQELLEAYSLLSTEQQEKIQINFAGGFSDESDAVAFSDAIRPYTNIRYHGVVKGKVKQNLLADAHVFCLPTYFPYEGQPISILEAYASGCCVITTNHAGIFDVFSPSRNGFEVEKRSPDSIRNILADICSHPFQLLQYGLANHEIANKSFRLQQHLNKLVSVVLNCRN